VKQLIRSLIEDSSISEYNQSASSAKLKPGVTRAQKRTQSAIHDPKFFSLYPNGFLIFFKSNSG
jgi:hypothetical protein